MLPLTSSTRIESVGTWDIPVTLMLAAIADSATRKLFGASWEIPKPLNADASVNTDLSIHTPPAFSVEMSPEMGKNCCQLSIVDGSAMRLPLITAAEATKAVIGSMVIRSATTRIALVILFPKLCLCVI